MKYEVDHIASIFLKAVFYNFYLVQSWILCSTWNVTILFFGIFFINILPKAPYRKVIIRLKAIAGYPLNETWTSPELLLEMFCHRSIFFPKVATSLTKRQSCFLVNFAIFLRISFLIEHLRWLLKTDIISNNFSDGELGIFQRTEAAIWTCSSK